jgi:hypothetical protein
MTSYPAQIDNNVTLPRVVDNQSPVGGDTVNRLRDAIIAIENELGAKPSGTFATVRARMDHIETLITQQVVVLAGDLGGTNSSPRVIGLQGRPLSSAAPTFGQTVGWNGIAWGPIDSVQLAQDLGNTSLAPYVVGLQGRPVSIQAPTNNQVLTWDGYIWKPVSQNVTLNVLPTVTLLPADLVFLGGDGYSSTTAPFRVGARAVDMISYPATTLDGRSRIMTFTANLEVTNPAAIATVQLKDVTSNAIITGPISNVSGATNASPIQITTTTDHSLVTGQTVTITSVGGNAAANGNFIVTVLNSTQFTLNGTTGSGAYTSGGTATGSAILNTSSQTATEFSAIIISGNYAGVMRTDQVSMYEVQIFLTGGVSTDQVICRNARVSVRYTPPVNITDLLSLAMPTDISFVAETSLNGFSTPAGIGGRKFDVTLFPALMTDGSGRQRTIEFYTDVEVSTPGVDGYIQLFDTTSNAVVNNTFLHFTNTLGNEVHSIPLVVGTSPGDIRSDIVPRYEVQIWKASSSPTDRVICNNARLTIFYL